MNPATPWPHIEPSEEQMPTVALAYAREVGGNRSPVMEYTSGNAPPTAMPVSARSANSCQYSVTKTVRRHGPWPSTSVATSTCLRCTTSHSSPMTSVAGNPSRKNATEICPPSLASRSSSSYPKKSAIWLRLGAMRFWSE